MVPRALYERFVEPDARNLVPESLNCLLVRSEDKLILIDNGLGNKLNERETQIWGLERPTGGLVDGLNRLGYTPEEIDIVIDTHLHWDHCGGNTVRKEGEIQPTFANASYLVQRMEWADASHPNARTRATYLAENFQPLVQKGQMRLMHGDEQITRHVRCVMAPGHTRGHQVVTLETGNWRGVFVSDLATFSVHMARTGWVTAFDVEPLENIYTKRKWQKWALEREAWLFFIHDPQLPVARLSEESGKLSLQPIEEARPLIASLPTPPQPAE